MRVPPLRLSHSVKRGWTGNPASANSIAGAKASARDMVPWSARALAQPSTTPGTVEHRGPCSGIPSAYNDFSAAIGAGPQALIPVTPPSPPMSMKPSPPIPHAWGWTTAKTAAAVHGRVHCVAPLHEDAQPGGSRLRVARGHSAAPANDHRPHGAHGEKSLPVIWTAKCEKKWKSSSADSRADGVGRPNRTHGRLEGS